MIKNIIFDFGGVIYDIKHALSKKAFEELGIADFDKLYGHQVQTGLFEQFERGEVTDEHFYNTIRQNLPEHTTNHQIEKAWNALLIGFDTKKIDLLKRLKKHYKIFLLSNTNRLHHKQFIDDLSAYVDFDSLFNDAWYSHLKQMRKPEDRIYLSLLEENGLKASETLFIDDLDTNINAAKKLGLYTYYLKNNESILKLFNNSDLYKYGLK